MSNTFLDYTGLSHFWDKIKALLDNKVDIVSGKSLSTNDFTTAYKNKLDGIAAGANAYTHPTYTAKESGLYKVTVDGTGHVSATAAVSKSDITGLGIPGSDTDTKVNVTLNTTSKAYLLGTTTTPTSTAAGVTAVSDTGVYLDTTAGKLTASSFAGNGASLTSLNGSNISSGTVAADRIASLAASKITSGTFDAARIPDLDASKITSGTLDASLLPSAATTDEKVKTTLATTTKAYVLGTSSTPTSSGVTGTAVADTGVYLDTTAGKLTAASFAGNGAGLTSLNGSNISSGTVDTARIGNLSAAKITSGTMDAARLPSASSSAAGIMSASDYTKLAGFSAASNYALKSDIASAYIYKGSVAGSANLPTTGNTTGDVYNVEDTGMNYAWTGTAWDALGTTLSIDSITNAEIDEMMAGSPR